MKPRLAPLALALTLALPTRVSAQPAPDPAALLREGVSLRQQGRDEEALDRFRRAWELTRSPQARGQMGLAAQALGRWSDADEFLREALDVASDPWVIAFRRPLDQALAAVAQHMGLLDLRGNLPGAEVFVDGRRVGALPMDRPTRVVAGGVTVEVRAPGHYPVSRQVTIPGGGIARETVELRPLPTPPSLATPPAPPPIATPPAASAVTPPPAPLTPPPDRGATLRIVGITGIALGGALAGLGVAGVVIRNNAAERYNAEPCISAPDTHECTSHLSSVNTGEGMALGGFIAGGVALAAGAVLLVVAPSRPGPRAWACAPSLSSPGMACALRF